MGGGRGCNLSRCPFCNRKASALASEPTSDLAPALGSVLESSALGDRQWDEIHAVLHEYGNFMYLFSNVNTDDLPAQSTRINSGTAYTYVTSLAYMSDALMRVRMGLGPRRKVKGKYYILFEFLNRTMSEDFKGDLIKLLASVRMSELMLRIRCARRVDGHKKRFDYTKMSIVCTKNQRKDEHFDCHNQFRAVLKKFAFWYNLRQHPSYSKVWREATERDVFFYDTKPLKHVRMSRKRCVGDLDLSLDHSRAKPPVPFLSVVPEDKPKKRARREPTLSLLFDF